MKPNTILTVIIYAFLISSPALSTEITDKLDGVSLAEIELNKSEELQEENKNKVKPYSCDKVEEVRVGDGPIYLGNMKPCMKKKLTDIHKDWEDTNLDGMFLYNSNKKISFSMWITRAPTKDNMEPEILIGPMSIERIMKELDFSDPKMLKHMIGKFKLNIRITEDDNHTTISLIRETVLD